MDSMDLFQMPHHDQEINKLQTLNCCITFILKQDCNHSYDSPVVERIFSEATTNFGNRDKIYKSDLRWNFTSFNGVSTFTSTVYVRCAATVNSFGIFDGTALADGTFISVTDAGEQTAKKIE